jgi:hypothetical protein
VLAYALADCAGTDDYFLGHRAQTAVFGGRIRLLCSDHGPLLHSRQIDRLRDVRFGSTADVEHIDDTVQKLVPEPVE